MANAFSLTGDYHVNEVIGPANTLGQAGKNIRGCKQEAPLEMDGWMLDGSTRKVFGSEILWDKRILKVEGLLSVF